MAWVVVDHRERALRVAAAEDGLALLTDDTLHALRFERAAEARAWLAANIKPTSHAQLALMRDGPAADDPEPEHPRKGQVGHYRPRGKA